MIGHTNASNNRPSYPLKYGYELERAAVSISLLLDLSDCFIYPTALFIACRSEKVRRGAVIAFPVRRIGVDAAGIRSAPVCFSRSDTSQKPASAGPGERLASVASRIASRSQKGSGATALRIGDFGHPVRADLCRLSQSAVGNGNDDWHLDRVFVLRIGSLSGALQSVAVGVDCPPETVTLLPSLHEQQALFWCDVPALGPCVWNYGSGLNTL